ncbi:DNA polymerase III subunit gamma and tau [Plantibacter flavus]|uniref:DNA polymerase III subunit gamma and tau n=1 Tax=Plantibacter flavus TaxID=150123 RepID=UPI002379EB2B|nr:DNA polymerase III subunit gamma and tau [Plantibacter flavus]MDD9153944.1 DNA polymerase III subunit gamma and tau [Plantibacter flavus]
MVTALYRRYRPETFADLIGQAQVTDPLMTALRTNRVNHAYLFSGPRGCGKTTSARILARCLNCAEGPTDTPCGVCASCVDLSRDGSGSLDVVEIDAASHNGVDDARDLRERAIFAPARDRYKIFILDEAHMVTPQGFNALLKIVEEPPEHVKFIFATTEPDKVIGTIRSRTHHYPFRLIPPAQMLDYVQQLCESEHVGVEAGVLPLVVRAGGGSARDTLSLLDQLMAGSEGDSVDYERAVALLGYTHTALLDEVVDALAARDSGAAFSTVDRVIQTGQDPRRFVDDLLERLRDLIVVAATGENAAAVLRGLPQDELDKMLAQARAFGIAELSRTADVVNEALTQMTGATSPRLHLELMMARILVPAADDSARGALARVERLERRIGVEGGAIEGGQAAVSAQPAVPTQPVVADRAAASAGAPVSAGAVPASTAASSTPAPAPAAASTASAAPDRRPAQEPDHAQTAVPTPAAPRVGPVTLQHIRDAWPEIVARVEKADRKAWMIVVNTQVGGYSDDDVLTLVFANNSDLNDFKARHAPGTGVAEVLRTAVLDVLGVRVKYLAKVAGADEPPAPRATAPATGAPSSESSAWSTPSLPQTVPAPAAPELSAGSGGSGSRSSWPTVAPAGGEPASAAPADAAPSAVAPSAPASSVAAPVEEQTSVSASSWATVAPPADEPEPVDGPDSSSVSAPATRPSSVPEPVEVPTSSAATASSTQPSPAPEPVEVPTSSPAPASSTQPSPAPEPVEGPTSSPAPASSTQPSPVPEPVEGQPGRPAGSGAPETPASSPAQRQPSTPPRQQAPARGPSNGDALGSRTVTWDVVSIPSDDDAPPADDEPPYPDPFESSAPAPSPAAVAPSAAPAGSPQAAPPAAPVAEQRPQPPVRMRQAPPVPTSHPAGDNRYGESVVRELLGATFIEEQPHEPRSGGR